MAFLITGAILGITAVIILFNYQRDLIKGLENEVNYIKIKMRLDDEWVSREWNDKRSMYTDLNLQIKDLRQFLDVEYKEKPTGLFKREKQ